MADASKGLKPQPTATEAKEKISRPRLPRLQAGVDYKDEEIYEMQRKGMSAAQVCQVINERNKGKSDLQPLKVQLIALKFAAKNGKPILEWAGTKRGGGNILSITRATVKEYKLAADGKTPILDADGRKIETGKILKDLGLRAAVPSHILIALGATENDTLVASHDEKAGTILLTLQRGGNAK